MRRIGLLVLGFFLPATGYSFTYTVNENGLTLRWKGDRHVRMYATPLNNNGLDHNVLFNTLVRGFRMWERSANDNIKFDYWQNNSYRRVSTNDKSSNLYFASHHEAGDPPISDGVIGLTQVFYDVNTGEILEADVVLNDINYEFTHDRRDTTMGGLGRKVYIGNVVTHELGHVFGIGHSPNLQATMFYLETKGNANLSCDDIAAMRSAYSPTDSGSLRGRVVGPNGQPVFGAHVSAISQRRGVTLATGVTDANGIYNISGLEAGRYGMMVEPLYAGPSILSSYYRSANTRICSGGDFPRTFEKSSRHNLRYVDVGSGVSPVSEIQLECTGETNAESPVMGATLPEAEPALVGESGLMRVDWLPVWGEAYYDLGELEGSLNLQAMSFSAYSPILAELELLDAGGNPVAAQVSSPSYQSLSGYKNFDSHLVAENLTLQNYYLRVQTRSIPSGNYPGSSSAIDSKGFVVFTATQNAGTPPNATDFFLNSRCSMDMELRSYQSPPSDAQINDDDELEDEINSFLGFCGSAQLIAEGAKRRANGQEIAGWFLPWGLMLAFAFLMRDPKRYRFAPRVTAFLV